MFDIRTRVWGIGVALAGVIAPSLIAAQNAASPESCAALAELKLPGVLSIEASTYSDGAFQPPAGFLDREISGLPPFCRVSIVVEPEIGIEVWMPTEGWNGRFKGMGSWGWGGFMLWPGLADAISDGYATATTDTGHNSSGPLPPPLDASFALDEDNTVKAGLLEDFAIRSLAEMTEKANSVIASFYQQEPAYSYWEGCSSGGRQGLAQIQATPEAYDGVLAGAPAIQIDRFHAAHLWPQIVMHQELDGVLPACKSELANNAAIEACDTLDGLADGLLADPQACAFDASELVCQTNTEAGCDCLTESEAKAVNLIWDGAQRADGSPMWPGLERGTSFGLLSGETVFPITEGHLWLVKKNDVFDWKTLGYDGFETYFDESVDMLGDVLGTDDPDLSSFAEAGGKLIMWHGFSDESIFPGGTVNYYGKVVEHAGGPSAVESFMRFFMAPGVAHCGGGYGPNAFGQTESPSSAGLAPDADHDMFQALVDWVENGAAPDQIIATKYVNNDPAAGVERTRPLCPYPLIAVYDGTGSPENATSFSCR